MSITVITPAISERFEMLKECLDSVSQQTIKPESHLIGIDYNKIGAGAICNKLIEGVTTEWVAFLADDDIFYPNHLETLLNNAEEENHLVYTWCEVTGRGNWNPNGYFDPFRLRTSNYIPSTVLFRTETFKELGGFDNTPFIAEDWDMWIRLLNNKGPAAFKCIDQITWCYRFHGRNISDGWIPE